MENTVGGDGNENMEWIFKWPDYWKTRRYLVVVQKSMFKFSALAITAAEWC